MKKSILTILWLFTLSINAQRGEEKQQTLSLDRNHYTFNGDKSGFNFSGLGFGYQFVNCGGDVQLGINFNKNVNFTTFSYNNKNLGPSEVGSDLWPKPNEIEIHEVEANLYFGSQNLGKVNLNYIVGNFSGCFGETFDVLKQVGQDPKAKKYKDNINDLRLQNIKIIRGDAIGDNRRRKIIQKIKDKETDNEIFRIKKLADVESSLGNYETARTYYEQANRLKSDPETQNRIAEMNRLINERNNKEKESISSPQPTSSAISSSKNNTASQPKNTVKTEPEKKPEKQEEKKKEEKEDTYIDRSARNEVRQNLGLNNTYNNSNQNNNAMVTQGYAINQQSKRTEQAIDNAVGQINSIFQANMDRIDREKKARDAQEDDSYENTALYRADQKRKKQEREAEIWRKNQLANKAQSRQQRLDAFNAKGGQQNFNFQFSVWNQKAMNETDQIKKYVTQYGGTYPVFKNLEYKTNIPQNNCDFVQVIESIQNSNMPNTYKNILIRNVLNIRFEYYKFYIDNAYIDVDWKAGKDNMYWDVNYMQCGNYLDEIAFGLGTDLHNTAIYGTGADIFGSDDELVITNSYSNNMLSKGNYSIPVGSFINSDLFKKEIRNIGITMPSHLLLFFVGENKTVWKEYQNRPYDWSRGDFREANIKYRDGLNYVSKILTYDASARKSEIDKYIALYNLKRKYALNTKEEEAKLMYFNYHMGNHQEAFNHLQRFLFLEYVNFKGLVDYIKNTDGYILDMAYTDMHIGVAAAQMFMENKEFEKALELTNLILEINKNKYLNSTKSITKETHYNPLITAAIKISNKVHYQMGNYDKMLLPKDEESIKKTQTSAEQYFKFIPRRTAGLGDRAKTANKRYNAIMPKILEHSEREYLEYMDPHIHANALIKLGNTKLAKAVLDDMVKYYTKKDKNNSRVFYGSPLDIDVFKEAVKTLFPGKEDNIDYRLGNLNLFKVIIESQRDSPSRYLTSLTIEQPKTINTNLLDLSTHAQWVLVKESLSKHGGTKEELITVFDNLNKIYTTGKLENNNEAQFFLKVYVQYAIALGKFHEAIPAMFELDNDYQNHGLILEHNLLKLMWPQKQNDLNKKFEDAKTGLYTKPSLLKTYFDSELKNSKHLKTSLNNYLSLWSDLKVSSPMIPYLYSLYEN